LPVTGGKGVQLEWFKWRKPDLDAVLGSKTVRGRGGKRHGLGELQLVKGEIGMPGCHQRLQRGRREPKVWGGPKLERGILGLRGASVTGRRSNSYTKREEEKTLPPARRNDIYGGGEKSENWTTSLGLFHREAEGRVQGESQEISKGKGKTDLRKTFEKKRT